MCASGTVTHHNQYLEYFHHPQTPASLLLPIPQPVLFFFLIHLCFLKTHVKALLRSKSYTFQFTH